MFNFVAIQWRSQEGKIAYVFVHFLKSFKFYDLSKYILDGWINNESIKIN